MRVISIKDQEFSLGEIEYIVAHRGLFQRAPIPDYGSALDEPYLWRAVLDRALLDYIKGPKEVGRDFARVSTWLNYKDLDEEGDATGDFGAVCAYAIVDEDTVRTMFNKCRYEEIQGDGKGLH